ncbi:hypothetical protein E6R60_14865 [Streptomyces sp. A0642]|nr:hypothetical protein E6R60_14865 [Streptomyces sp. A0642]
MGSRSDERRRRATAARGWVYGHDHDALNPGLLPHQTYPVLVGGPLDGLLLDILGWRSEDRTR